MIQILADDETIEVLINNIAVDILDVGDDYVLAECDPSIFTEVTVDDSFPSQLILQVRSEYGFDTYLFHELRIFRVSEGLALDFICHTPNKYWEGQWGLATLLEAIKYQSEFVETLSVVDIELEDDWKRLVLRRVLDMPTDLPNALTDTAAEINRLIRGAEVSLAGMEWKSEYEKNESLFCTEVLTPLLRRMGFVAVRYRHGTKEYGKDYTFSEMTPFGQLRNYGLQAKAGDVSGGVNSDIDKLIGQLNDAFSMPYYELGSKDPHYISTFIIAISGHFTDNAREKIVEKMPKGVIGSVYFLDRENILELIERYWLS